MTTHTIHSRQVVPRPRKDVFAFFAEPRNLARLTPSSMAFEFLSHDFEMREGLEIEYRLRPLLGVPVTWRTLITDYDPPHGFTDVQLSGPYRRWEHRHTLSDVSGGTLVEDSIEYELPLGLIGDLGHRWMVRDELARIFHYRARSIERIFEQPQHNPDPHVIAVAGGTGFIGGAIARELFRRGEKVAVLSHRGDVARGSLPDGVTIRLADATVADGTLDAQLAGIDDLVISLAFANLPIEAPRRGRTFAEVDATGTERLVDAARKAGVKRIVYISGAGAAPRADKHWFREKWRAEEAVRRSGLAWSIVRPTWVYGPDDSSLNRFIAFARRLQFVPMTNLGRQQMAPVFIDDVARLVADAVRDPRALGEVFEIGGPETMPMREVIRRALSVAKISRPIVPGPSALIKLGAAPLTLLPEPPLTPDAVDFINQPARVDVAPLLARMPRRLTPFREGLSTYLTPGSGPGSIRFDERDQRPVGAALQMSPESTR